MNDHRTRVPTERASALLTDLYELTMVQAYWSEGRRSANLERYRESVLRQMSG